MSGRLARDHDRFAGNREGARLLTCKGAVIVKSLLTGTINDILERIDRDV